MGGMIKDTPFNKAQDAFKDFLKKQGLPVDLLWLFCEDVISESGEYLIRVPSITRNEKLAEECYELGRNRGFGVALHRFCLLDKRVCCYIQLPEDDLDSQHKLMSDICEIQCGKPYQKRKGNKKSDSMEHTEVAEQKYAASQLYR
jgi:hypothetical protein